MINPRIKDLLSEYKIGQGDGLSVLLSFYYDCEPSFLPEIIKKKVLATGICVFGPKGVEWNVPLFEDQLTDFEWVKEYVAAFKNINPNVPGTVTESTKRFKKFFAENPTVRFEDIKNAFNMYAASLTDPKYIMYPHYFIFKDKGLDKTSMLEYWLEQYYKTNKGMRERSSLSNTMK